MKFTVNDLQKQDTDFLSLLGDMKRVAIGDRPAFTTRHKGIKAFIQAKNATTPRTMVADSQITLDTISVSARPVIDRIAIQTGRVNMSDLAAEASQAMTHQKIKYIWNVLENAVTTWAHPFYGEGSGIVSTTFDPMVLHWLRSGGCTILGDIEAVGKLAGMTGFVTVQPTTTNGAMQFSNDIINEFNRSGMVGAYRGASVVKMVNPYEDDGVTPLLDTGKLFLLPTGAAAEARPLKIVEEGDVFSMEATNIDDLKYELRLDQYFGAGIVTGTTPAMGCYQIN